jgi:formate dehydrogenase subunit beta
MSKSTVLKVKGSKIRETINAFLQDLLNKKVVAAILVPVVHPAGNNVVQSLVTNPELLAQADVLAPVLPVNSARIISAITRIAPLGKKTAVVMKSCELRALIELVKLKQVSLDNLVLIGVDCPGAYPVKDYPDFSSESTSDDFVRGAWQGKEDLKLRPGCQICEYPMPLTSDITIGLLGVDLSQELILQANTEEGEKVIETLGLSETENALVQKREVAVSQLLSEIKKQRQEFFKRTEEEIGGLENLASVFAPCIKCHNCKTVCPVCYCRECFFDSPTFDLEADRYLGLADKRGAIRMPVDTLFFHITRMTHMSASCVGCGCCEEACPNDIPLLKIFQLTGDRVQKLFDYIPGRNLEDELPAAAFREDELQWIGEK